ncbi:hypothetical protein BDY24DRAFT_414459 [Mrakia frigida]|uniref:uncharacterized protein n=1 Tax=Mrakia frigida TaxID=29902 RepID=UPI003FCC0711
MGNVASILKTPDLTRVTTPIDYVVPNFPSLYTPTYDQDGAFFLYFAEDMWRFTLLWTLIVIGSIHFCCGLIAGIVFSRRHPMIAISIPFIATAMGLLMGLISSTVVGFVLAALYQAAHFQMATYVLENHLWVPFIFALIQGFVVVLGSYNTLSTIL